MMQIQGQGNQLVQPLATTMYREHKDDFVATLMDHFKSGKDIDPGQVATVTALGNIFSARSTTTATTSNKEAWYNSNKNEIYA